MPTYLITAEDRQWFADCRRAWSLGARARGDLEPVAVASGADQRQARALRDALAVHYFPGMWEWNRAIVDPLVAAAVERAGGGRDEHLVIDAYRQWAASVDSFRPLWVDPDIEVNIPDPDRPDCDLAADNVAIVKYRDRAGMLVSERRATEERRATDESRDRGGMVVSERRSLEEYWLVEHRIVEQWASEDELALDERGILACWAWGQFNLHEPIEGTLYNELQTDPPSFRRTRVHRSQTEQAEAAARLGRTAKQMLAAPAPFDPTPGWSHCQRCAFRAPCITMNQGGDADQVLAENFRQRPPDAPEEGRLGGATWGMGRGLAAFSSRRRS